MLLVGVFCGEGEGTGESSSLPQPPWPHCCFRARSRTDESLEARRNRLYLGTRRGRGEVRPDHGGLACPAKTRLCFWWAMGNLLSKAEVLISHSCSQNTTKTILPTWREGKQRLREGQQLAWRLPATCLPAAESGAPLLLALRETGSDGCQSPSSVAVPFPPAGPLARVLLSTVGSVQRHPLHH